MGSPLQTTRLLTLTVAVGFTTIVKLLGVPTHVTPPLVKLGVTVTVAVTGVVPVLMAVNEEMLPVPLAARPIEVLSLLHA